MYLTTFINREFSKFKYVKTKTTIFFNDIVALKVKNVLHRINFALEQKRERKQEWKRKRERELIIFVAQRKNIISTINEDKRRRNKNWNKNQKWSREQKRRDWEQIISK
jgi:hypothetical protein